VLVAAGFSASGIFQRSISVEALAVATSMSRLRSQRSNWIPVLGAGLVVSAFVILSTVGLSAGASPAVALAALVQKPTCQATINQVSGLSIRNLSRTIVIIGTCFGSHPTYVNVSSFNVYTGKDTQNCGTGPTPPTMSIGEWASSGTGDWSAGRFIATGSNCFYGDGIGLFYKSWSSTKIVIDGFGNALGTTTQNSGAPYQMAPHAECSVYVHNPANEPTPANYTMPKGTC
jgi:hypothetical protein